METMERVLVKSALGEGGPTKNKEEVQVEVPEVAFTNMFLMHHFVDERSIDDCHHHMHTKRARLMECVADGAG
jgi:hypothetical protein